MIKICVTGNRGEGSMASVEIIVQALLADDNTNSIYIVDNGNYLYELNNPEGKYYGADYIDNMTDRSKYIEQGLHIIKNSTTEISNEISLMIDKLLEQDGSRSCYKKNYIIFKETY